VWEDKEDSRVNLNVPFALGFQLSQLFLQIFHSAF
jgi:hypothetical protein